MTPLAQARRRDSLYDDQIARLNAKLCGDRLRGLVVTASASDEAGVRSPTASHQRRKNRFGFLSLELGIK